MNFNSSTKYDKNIADETKIQNSCIILVNTNKEERNPT